MSPIPATIVSGGFAALNFGIFFATRYVGILAIIKWTKRRFFLPEVHTQENTIDMLNHIKPEYLDEINRFLIGKELQKEQTLLELMQHLDKLSTENPENALFTPVTNKEKAAAWAKILSGLILMTVFTPAAFITFAQMGYNGFALLGEACDDPTVKNLSETSKQGLSAMPGLSSSLFYMISAIKLPLVLGEMFTYLYYYHTPLQAIGALTLIAANIASFPSQQGLAQSVVNDPKHIFPNVMNNSYINTAAGGAIVTNASATLKKVYGQNGIPVNPHATRLDTLVNFFNDPVQRKKISRISANQINRLSLFSHPNLPASSSQNTAAPVQRQPPV